MSILDGLPRHEDEIIRANQYAAAALQAYLAKHQPAPAAEDAIDLLKKGIALGDLLDISSDEFDALFVKACQDIQFGEIERARDLLTMLHVFQPLEAKVVYALACTYQLAADHVKAGKLYVQFLARDATNPEGYLRLGECFLANKEYAMAIDTFQLGIVHADHGASPEEIRSHTEQLISVAKAQIAGFD